MSTTKRWLRMMVSGLLLTGCGGGLEPVADSGLEAQGPVDAQAIILPGSTPLPAPSSTPPAVVDLSTVTDMRALWPSTASVRRQVVLVAYTLPPTSTGYRHPPRFRAFGLDMATRQYLFQVDGERATYLGAFTEAMLLKGAILISTPPGVKYDGSCSALTAPSASGRVTASTLAADCATDPITRSSGSTQGGGHEWAFNWAFSWAFVSSLPNAVNNLLTHAHYGASAYALDAPEAAEAR